jgi:undecaprenyl diphosphate synthase
MDNRLPQHVAIIMDGNGRWAKKKNRPRIFGHREGMKRVREIVEYARKEGIKVLSLFAFSSENWNRPLTEINFLMSLLEEYVKKEVSELKKNNIQLRFIGDLKKLPEKYYALVKRSEEELRDCSGMVLNIALSYGGRQEIIFAIKNLIKDVENNVLNFEDINEQVFANYLFTKDLPNPDLLIRTSGEMRISNFFLWQIAYTELYITETFWPDFKEKDFQKALDDYAKRERRFGKISEQIRTE